MNQTKGIRGKPFVVLAVIAALAIVGVVLGAKNTSRNYFNRLTVKVVPATTTYAQAGEHPTGPFCMQGEVFFKGMLDENGNPSEDYTSVGEWTCWGWMMKSDGYAAANDSYDLLPLGGRLELQGHIGDTARSIVGGTGIFKDARGEVSFKALDEPAGAFLVTFEFFSSTELPEGIIKSGSN
ncbi:MAG: hypothetical protein ACJ74G_14630 [Blastocatellia bacterium]